MGTGGSPSTGDEDYDKQYKRLPQKKMTQSKKPKIAFLWRSEEMTPEVIDMARRTETGAIFDLTFEGSSKAVHGRLRTAGSMGVSDIMVLPSFLEETRFQDILVSGGIRNVWVEIHPRFFNGGLPSFFKALERIPDHCRCFPVMGYVPWLIEILKTDRKIPNIVLKGSEASGFVSSETILTLYATVQNIMWEQGTTANLFLWGGIGTPEAAGAFLSAGAAGIVFESLHWLTDLVRIDDRVRQRIEKLRPEHTELVEVAQQNVCRLYNKGNSIAVKALGDFEAQGDAETREKENDTFALKIQSSWVHPLSSRFSARELIFLGVEAGFAASFKKRYGCGTEQAVREFVSDVTACCMEGNRVGALWDDHPAAREMGTPYPFIQGAMSWISDVPEFSRAVSEAGGLPTVALGLLHGRELKERLDNLSDVMAGRSYAVNFIALPENPYKEEQLAWIRALKPRFAVIAAGDPSYARELKRQGMEVIYVAPDAAMMKLAFDAGVRYVICEGNEAGGHVGRHSTTTLAQMVHELKRHDPLLFMDRKIILAGGIFDRTTAFIAARLGADAIQLGTAYLATEEIVKTGALPRLYQQMILRAKPGGTVVSGVSVGLGVRALKTPKASKIRVLEHELRRNNQSEKDIRQKLEDLSVGSLLIAARGLERAGGAPLDEKICATEGHFMSGACAGAIHKIRSVKELHRELAKGRYEDGDCVDEATSERPRPLTQQREGRILSGIAGSGKGRDRVVVTGMNIFNALGNGLDEVWAGVLAMKSGVDLVPPSKWDHSLYYEPRLNMPDKTYCRVGAFGNLRVSRKQLGIAPHDFRTMTGATRMTLWLAQKAVLDSGILNSDIPSERIGVLISQNSGEAAGTLPDILIRSNVHHIMEAVKRAVPLTPEMEKAVMEEIKAGRNSPDDTTLLGRLNCVAAGFICLKYGFMGPSFSLSAACATSLAAIYTAVQMIRNGAIDAALVGGAEELLMPLHFVEFSALGVLAGSSGNRKPPAESSRPFDVERDGMVLGEGGGMVVVERESIARKRGAEIHGFITGIGGSNSHSGLVEPSGMAQEMAIRASFEDAGYGPECVDLVECHATGTVQGDVEEVHALKTFYGNDKPTAITSFKSQIGHTLGASGINSLIRGILAMKTGILPPSINCAHPDPALGIEGSPLQIPGEPADWKVRNGRPRRVQVNAFGFGGSNYVVQMEQCVNGLERRAGSPKKPMDHDSGKKESFSIPDGMSFFHIRFADKSYRLAVLSRNEEEAMLKLKDLHHGRMPPFSEEQERKLAKEGIYLGLEKKTPPALAFIFPGQGSHYAGMGRELYDAFPLIREWMDAAASLADFDLLNLLFHGAEDDLQKTWVQQPALFALECAIANQLRALNVRPSAVAGHSVGEMAALWAAGVYSFEDGFRLVNTRARCMKKAAALHGDPGMMIAVHAAPARVEALISGRKDVCVANINSPNQVVLSGKTDALIAMGRELKRLGFRFTPLKVGMAFHSPMMKVVREEFKASISGIPLHSPRIPVLSNTTGIPFPSHESEIRNIIVSQMEAPVCWMADILAIQKDYHIEWFVETGPRKVLANLLLDTLDDGKCIPTCLPLSEKSTCRAAIARLFVNGNLVLSEAPQFLTLQEKRTGRICPVPDGDAIASPQGIERRKSDAYQEDVIEAVIDIIVEATGYERDEIDQNMDLRDDLAIRSSRLPVLVDAMERHFGIPLDLADLVDIRTVVEIAAKVEESISRGSVPSVDVGAKFFSPLPPKTGQDVKRILFSQTPLEDGSSRPILLNPDDAVCILTMGKRSRFQERYQKFFQQEYGVTPIFQRLPDSGGGKFFTPASVEKGMAKAIRKLKVIPSLAGVVLDFSSVPVRKNGSMDEVPELMSLVFSMLKTFMESPNRKFALLVHDCEEDGLVRILVEGVLGMFLSCAHEYPSMVFRTVGLDHQTDPEIAMHNALNGHDAVIERNYDHGEGFTMEGFQAPLVYENSPDIGFIGKEVVVFSGGGSGITSQLACALVPFDIKAVLLGRTDIDPGYDFSSILSQKAPVDDAICRMINEKYPDISKEAFSKEMGKSLKALKVARTLENLRSQGVEANYYTCDVTRSEEVERVFGVLLKRHGRIDGIVHGAGVIKDLMIRDMAFADFSSVIQVKFLGALNLFRAAKDKGLKFFTCLSSVVSILGNPGQVNYSAANRIMSALFHHLKKENPSIRFKSLILPPIEGVGMAEDVWVRKTMEKKNIGYVHVDELAALFLRETCFGVSEHSGVMFMRSLPPLKTVRLNPAGPSPVSGKHFVAGLVFHQKDFPMIDSVTYMDLQEGVLIAHRSFSEEKDAWLNDHKPLKSMQHPVVSGIILVETLMEAARVLYPYVRPRRISDVWFFDMVQCPSGIARPTTISCRRVALKGREIFCEASLAIERESSEKHGKSAVTCCKAIVVLGNEDGLLKEMPGFPIRMDELDTPPVDYNGILNYYEQHSDLQGRYRINMQLYGTGPEVVSGRMTYREGRDFSHLDDALYQYSPYLLETFFHLPGLYAVIRGPAGGRNLIPVGIEEMVWAGKCGGGEKISLHARMKKDLHDGSLWDVMALNGKGEPLMVVKGLRMRTVPV